MSNIVIIGSGPAGVSAALYAARAGVQTTVLTKGPGALDRAELIQNYYGFAEPITGAELERRGIEGAKAVGVEFVTTEAVGLTYTDKLTVETLAGDFPADAVILATGASRAAPRIPGLAGLEGRGVSYCATCDGMLCRGKPVAVVGRSPDAPEEANFLKNLGCQVTYLAPKRPEALEADIPFVPTGTVSIQGQLTVTGLTANGETIPCAGVFILRPAVAPTDLLPTLATANGSIQVDRSMATNLPGLFAAGDCTGGPLQVSKAAGDGLIAGQSAAAWAAAQERREKQS